MEGKLYIVGTPIGNLNDLSKRAEETLKKVDIILAEDTRVTQKLLFRLNIKKTILRYDDYARETFYKKILNELRVGKDIALVVDAGTPNIADPGYKLTAFIRKENIKIIPIPGPSSITTALSACGINGNKFTFLGYPPHKKGRNSFFKEINAIKWRPVIILESPHRLLKTLSDLEKISNLKSEITIAKELTKIHEEIWVGEIERAKEYFKNEKGRGEFIIIIP